VLRREASTTDLGTAPRAAPQRSRLRPRPVLLPGTDGYPLALHDFGGEGADLLLVHATGMHGWAFQPVAERMRARYHCWALDLRGHGDSAMPPTALHWNGFGADVVTVIDHLASADLVGVGHSMGGAALVMAAAERPQAFRSLFLYEPAITPPIGHIPEQLAAHQVVMVEAARRRRAHFGSRAEALESYARKRPTSDLNAGALSAYVEHGFADLDGRGVYLKCTPATEAATFASTFSQETRACLDRVRCPVHVAYGTETDEPNRDTVRALAATFGTEVVVLEALSHFGPLQNPTQFARVLERTITVERTIGPGS
jgi:pimeloyl-ACP methyl ester carboxylesterase